MCLSNLVKLEAKRAKATISELWQQGQNNAKDVYDHPTKRMIGWSRDLHGPIMM